MTSARLRQWFGDAAALRIGHPAGQPAANGCSMTAGAIPQVVINRPLSLAGVAAVDQKTALAVRALVSMVEDRDWDTARCLVYGLAQRVRILEAESRANAAGVVS